MNTTSTSKENIDRYLLLQKWRTELLTEATKIWGDENKQQNLFEILQNANIYTKEINELILQYPLLKSTKSFNTSHFEECPDYNESLLMEMEKFLYNQFFTDEDEGFSHEIILSKNLYILNLELIKLKENINQYKNILLNINGDTTNTLVKTSLFQLLFIHLMNLIFQIEQRISFIIENKISSNNYYANTFSIFNTVKLITDSLKNLVTLEKTKEKASRIKLYYHDDIKTIINQHIEALKIDISESQSGVNHSEMVEKSNQSILYSLPLIGKLFQLIVNYFLQPKPSLFNHIQLSTEKTIEQLNALDKIAKKTIAPAA